MRKFIQGIVDFRESLTEESRALFAKLALGQKPDALFIACSDSRVVPNLFASTSPGDLFVLRNVGNLIPPVSATTDSSAIAALEFSLFSLNVTDIIVCGHSECGAMQALAKEEDFPQCSHLSSWLEYGKPAIKKVKEGVTLDSALSHYNQISQVNVLQQMEHIASYAFVQERLKNKQVRIHGCWYDIAHSDVFWYEATLNRFVLVDKEEAAQILKRIE